MKIVFVATPSIHFIRWVKNIAKENYELYWFDILDNGYNKDLYFLTQIIEWKKRKVRYVKGEYFLEKNTPKLFSFIEPILQVTVKEKINEIITTIQPDLVHSFEMQSCSYPLYSIMNKFSKINWLYSCWGSDLFFYQNFNYHKKKIKKVLKRINYLHTDCLRDYNLAKKLNFNGEYLGSVPGGGGYNLDEYNKYLTSFETRNIILVKGYQHKLGRGLNIVKALEKIQNKLSSHEIIIFAAHKEVSDYISKNNLPFKVYGGYRLSHKEVLKLMGKSKIYIGNSISDGIPNTLIESIIMGVVPIQSNPGGATQEIVENKKNGYLINDPLNIDEIKNIILEVLNSKESLINIHDYNIKLGSENFSYEFINSKIKNIYTNIFKCK